jgi:hypothetical protein
MSKLVKLPDGDWVRSSDILKIGKPYFNENIDCWQCSIAYKNTPYQDVTFHVFNLNKKFVRTEDKAIDWVNRYIDRFNEAL